MVRTRNPMQVLRCGPPGMTCHGEVRKGVKRPQGHVKSQCGLREVLAGTGIALGEIEWLK